MPFYILYKSEPRISTAEVVSCSNPIQPYTAYQPAYPVKSVDVKVRVGDEILEFKQLPAESVIADYGGSGIVVSDSREAITNEVTALKRSSEKILADVGRHEHIVAECEKILQDLNPQLRREVEQSQEIERLKSDLSDIKAMLSQALGQSKKE